jgi:GWxTD domain-containing protein
MWRMRIRPTAICCFVAIPALALFWSLSALAQAKVQPLASDEPTQTRYGIWLDQDVRWIITPEEKRAFLEQLNNDQERDEFIRQFWVRRNPNPHSAENEFKEEHYRRTAFANEHFAAGEPGWQTNRGRVYIVFGPPDSIDSHPAAGSSVTKSFEIWHYRTIRVGWPPDREDWRHTVQPTIIKNFDFKFVDECACGQYRLESPWPSAKSGTPASDPAPGE